MDALTEELACAAWNAEVVERESHVLVVPRWEELGDAAKRCEYAGIRAILSALASKSADALPSVDDLGTSIDVFISEGMSGKNSFCDAAAEAALTSIRAHVAPIIAAKDAALAEAQARAERAEGRLAAVLALTAKDLSDAHRYGAVSGVVDLVRSRANGTACNECGSTATKHGASLGTFCDNCAPVGADDPVLAAISRAPVATLAPEEQAELDRLAREAQIGPGVANDVVLFGLLQRAREDNDALSLVLAETRAARDADRAEIAKLDVRWRQHYRERTGLMMMLRHPSMTPGEVAREVGKQSPTIASNLEDLTRTLATAQELIEHRIASARDAALAPIKAELDMTRGLVTSTGVSHGIATLELSKARGELDSANRVAGEALEERDHAREERDNLRAMLEAERKTCEEAQALAVEATIALTEAQEKVADLESRNIELQQARDEAQRFRMGGDVEARRERQTNDALRSRIADLETQLRAYLARPTPIEPGQDMVEALVRHVVQSGASTMPEAIRAILSALAGMGAEALPSDMTIRAAWFSERSTGQSEMGIKSLFAPILAAKDARIRELEAQIRRLSCPICHGSGVLRGTNEYELDTQCTNVGEHG